jgi:hypothetical protein
MDSFEEGSLLSAPRMVRRGRRHPMVILADLPLNACAASPAGTGDGRQPARGRTQVFASAELAE